MPLRNAVQIDTDVEHIYAYEPTYGLNSAHPAAIDTGPVLYNLDKAEAELLARTVAPQLFTPDQRLQDIRNDLQETHDSYRRDRNAAQAGDWTATQVRDSLTDLLDHVRETLRKLDGLL